MPSLKRENRFQTIESLIVFSVGTPNFSSGFGSVQSFMKRKRKQMSEIFLPALMYSHESCIGGTTRH